ncbi:MAG: protein-glutamate O-methyltransferase CheR [Gemmatimonadota bacterium]
MSLENVGTLNSAMMDDEDGLVELKQKIQADRGFNCSFYKDKCLRRRVDVRMRVRGVGSFAEYASLLDEDAEEYDCLIDNLTVNVTKFFRDRDMWEVLEDQVVPALFDLPDRKLRVWSAGCASGEEPYSISIALREWAAREDRAADLDRLEIVGTDIDRGSLRAARDGVYPPLSLEDTPEEIRRRWFSSGHEYRLCEEARRSVSFEHRDVISDPPLDGCSLIFCRNVIIYLERTIQEELFQKFYEALVPGGYLVLGRVETLLGLPRRLFRPVSIRERIYRKPE